MFAVFRKSEKSNQKKSFRLNQHTSIVKKNIEMIFQALRNKVEKIVFHILQNCALYNPQCLLNTITSSKNGKQLLKIIKLKIKGCNYSLATSSFFVFSFSTSNK